MRLTKRGYTYLVLTTIGVVFTIYSIQVKNYILLIIAILFTLVSTDNIFCDLGKKK